MKTDKFIFAFLGIAALLFAAGVAYKVTREPAAVSKTAATQAKGGAKTARKPQAGNKDPLQGGAIQPVFYAQAKMKTLEQKITAALNQRKITLNDLDRLDFKGGGGEFDVFNPKGRIGFVPANGLWITPEVIEKMSADSDSKLVYNIQRVRWNGNVTETLYAIISDVDPKSCGGAQEYTVKLPVTIAADNSTVVDAPPGMPLINNGCLKTPDGKAHWFYKLRVRTRAARAKLWGSY